MADEKEKDFKTIDVPAYDLQGNKIETNTFCEACLLSLMSGDDCPVHSGTDEDEE